MSDKSSFPNIAQRLGLEHVSRSEFIMAIYRFFDIWRSRARMVEINFYRPIPDGSKESMPEWAETLAHDLEWPHFHMSWWKVVGRRLRRNYQWIY